MELRIVQWNWTIPVNIWNWTIPIGLWVLNLTWVLTNVTRPLLNGTSDTGLSSICIRMSKPSRDALCMYVGISPGGFCTFFDFITSQVW